MANMQNQEADQDLKSGFVMNWRHSVLLKIQVMFIGLVVVLAIAIAIALQTVSGPLLEEQALKQVRQSGNAMVAELEQRTALTRSLATALANLGESLPPDVEQHRQVVAHVMDYERTESFIAGGGIWPAPFAFDPAIERRSFFWGRDAAGSLQYYDDYNDPAGPGYHHEEWYVPASHLPEGAAFWSRSYMDPYSYQPMTTCTVPMFRGNERYGVSTVDLKLEGLHALLEDLSQKFGGYAFAVDRGGKFLSFPDESLTKVYLQDESGKVAEEFITAAELGLKDSRFQPIAEALAEINEEVIERAKSKGR